MKSVMYTEYSDLNKECFMNILAEVITDWATPEKLVKAGKRVGITSKGLSVERADAVLNPGTPAKTSLDLPGVISPESVRKDSAAYWKSKYTQAQEQYSTRQQLEFPLEQVDELLPSKKVEASATTKKKITDVHGSLKGTDVRKLIEQKEEDERKKEEKKKEREEKKEEMKMLFLKCQEKCLCSTKKCKAIQLQQCSVCKNVLKSKCGKKACKIDGEAPVMILVAAQKEKTDKRSRKRKDKESEESEEELHEDEVYAEQEGEAEESEVETEEEGYEGMWNSTDDESFSGFANAEEITSIKVNTRKSILFYFWTPNASWTGSLA